MGLACSSLRCPCVREKKACTNTCICKKCTNTYGVRPPHSTTRRRQAYDNQRYPLRGTPSSEFIKEVGEQNNGHFTTLEVLLLKSIVIFCIVQGINVSPLNISSLYKQIYYIMIYLSIVMYLNSLSLTVTSTTLNIS